MAVDRALRWGFTAAALGWAIVLPFAASLAAAPHAPAGEYVVAAIAYSVGGIVCHQQSGRSFHLFGVQLPVCARCTGIYAGAALAALFFAGRGSAGRAFQARRARESAGPVFEARQTAADPAAPDAARAVLIAACVPIALTLVFEWTTGITPSNTIRALSGVPLGAAVAWLIVGPLG